jgi:hypothetical protein
MDETKHTNLHNFGCITNLTMLLSMDVILFLKREQDLYSQPAIRYKKHFPYFLMKLQGNYAEERKRLFHHREVSRLNLYPSH